MAFGWVGETEARASLPPYCEISSRSRTWRLFPGARRVSGLGAPDGNGHERMGIWRYGKTFGQLLRHGDIATASSVGWHEVR
ncbi:hypothetical protein [Paractinoplanes atraurantiacus]|uniref:Uncharacterized protein n=1 Tax=Paractinoplanes atraurantiacus TaxID=1036182 RepID=A0A285IT71_9ACTN|nr:hypothetical protein [Actinoplanes atraurantiacus]SNY51192.1 hypothetical protein SAMN05421748_111210 [Actinoplanes atraurantiacus]